MSPYPKVTNRDIVAAKKSTTTLKVFYSWLSKFTVQVLVRLRIFEKPKQQKVNRTGPNNRYM